ncbi:hypothetical protein ADEAN_001017600 [Angomonas deanei]|uniref:Uncharacterized protein n=1 Tax=Angomonas deanei TaxID=59799 RepID=A0A7G2CWK7_9TRYP|nr:hypothetical protein ADEAN_001017600 [Angomonas deanei]
MGISSSSDALPSSLKSGDEHVYCNNSNNNKVLYKAVMEKRNSRVGSVPNANTNTYNVITVPTPVGSLHNNNNNNNNNIFNMSTNNISSLLELTPLGRSQVLQTQNNHHHHNNDGSLPNAAASEDGFLYRQESMGVSDYFSNPLPPFQFNLNSYYKNNINNTNNNNNHHQNNELLGVSGNATPLTQSLHHPCYNHNNNNNSYFSDSSGRPSRRVSKLLFPNPGNNIHHHNNGAPPALIPFCCFEAQYIPVFKNTNLQQSSKL